MKSSAPFFAIFDLDGVIVSTDIWHRKAWAQIAHKLNLPFTQAQALATRGVDRMASLEVVLGKRSKDFSADQKLLLAEEKNEIYKSLIADIKPRDLLPGALTLLDELSRRGIPCALGSASKNAPAVLKCLGIEDRFSAIVAGGDFKNGKPAPDIFLLAAKRLGVAKADLSKCVVFEDAEAGLQAARAAGMRCCAINLDSPLADMKSKDLRGITIPMLEELVKTPMREVEAPVTVKKSAAQTCDDPTWTLSEAIGDFERRLGRAAVFTLGNGYLGCRGFFEEEQEEEIGKLGGIYFAGIFGAGTDPAWEGAVRELVNTPNFLWLSIRANNEQVRLRPECVTNYRRLLDMRRGILTREYVFKCADDVQIKLEFERFISFANLHCAAQRVRITALNASVSLEIDAGIDAGITQHNLRMTLPLPVQPGRKQLVVEENSDILYSRVFTREDGEGIAEAQKVTVTCGGKELAGKSASTDERLAEHFKAKLDAGETLVLDKIACFYTTRDVPPQVGAPGATGARAAAAKAAVKRAVAKVGAYDKLRADHIAVWNKKWDSADVIIDGDDLRAIEDQRAVRFNIFHLIQAAPAHDSRVSLGARGLSGEMHDGSVFWDNEIFKLPFFTYIFPETTRSMLTFRHRTLPMAKKHAKNLWFEGAMYAWKSGPDGAEETAMEGGAYYAIHIIADIAYAIRQYWFATGDNDFMADYGTEILIETARFWMSRMQPGANDKLEILAVRGPNEYDNVVHNNAYTNMMARENLISAREAVLRLRKIAPEKMRALEQRLGFTDAEIKEWVRAAKNILVPRDESQNLILEDDAYLRRTPFQIARGKANRNAGARVIDKSLPYEAMAFYQITKQSDVVTLMNLLPQYFTEEERKIAYDFYEPRTVHDSSLSFAPHAVGAARLGRIDEAYRYFRECGFLDIADTQMNSISGIHFANLGGTWQAVVFGFAGLQIGGDFINPKATVSPQLPKHWARLRFSITLHGKKFSFDCKR